MATTLYDSGPATGDGSSAGARWLSGLGAFLLIAAGGTTLLVVGMLMERRDTGPLETGRRLVDLVAERFT